MRKRTIDDRIERKRFLFFQAGLIIAIFLVIAAFSIRGKAVPSLPDSQPEIMDSEINPVVVVLEEEIREPEKKEELKKKFTKIDPFKKQDEKKTDDKEEGPVVKLDTGFVFLMTKKEPADTSIYDPFMPFSQQVSFPGGEKAMMKWLSDHIRYPQMELENGIGGRVTVTFVVEKDGSISQVKVLGGVSPGLDREAMRVVKKMPRWLPGMQMDKKVRVRVTIPVMFKVVDF